MQEIIGSKEVSNSQNTPKNLPSMCSWPISLGLPGILAVDLWGWQCPFLGQLSHVMPSVRSAALPTQTDIHRLRGLQGASQNCISFL